MNVLVTRPEQSGAELVEWLNQQQIFAIHQPLFRIEAGRELPLLPSKMTQLNAGDYVFAVSKNAVDFAAATLAETGFHWRSDLNYFAVGRNSAHHFSAKTEQNVHYPFENENSEGLLELPEMSALAGKNLLILRAETGRNFFAEQAEIRGATIHYTECYQRVPLTANVAEQLSLAKRAGIDTIVATSGDILSSLFEQTLEEDRQWLFNCRLVVVGKRLAFLAKRLGWSGQISISNKADNASLLNELLREQQ